MILESRGGPVRRGEPDFVRGAGGARKHKPGRGHDRKSAEQHKEKATKKAEKMRQAEAEAIAKAEEVWKNMTEQAKKLRPDLDPARLRKR